VWQSVARPGTTEEVQRNSGPAAPIRLPLEFAGGRLRRLRPDDLASFQAYRADPSLRRFQGWSPMSDADALDFLSRMHDKPLLAPGQWLQLGIGAADDDELIGDIALYLSDDGIRSHIGFTLAPATQGRGIATAAVDAAVRLLFANTGQREVVGLADSRNLASTRLLDRAGFAFHEQRESFSHDGPCTVRVYVRRR
jgi:RimJ/RimL family protein N-acetyltransferase